MSAAAEIERAASLDRQEFAHALIYAIRREEMGTARPGKLPPIPGLCRRRHRWRGARTRVVAQHWSAEVTSCADCDAMRGRDYGEGAHGHYRYQVAMGAAHARRLLAITEGEAA